MTFTKLMFNKQVLLALGMIVFIGAVVAAGTGAFFSSQASATGNVFTAGTLDLMITRENDGPNPADTKDAEWVFDNMAPGGTPVEESMWLRNVGSIEGASVAFGADFSGQGAIAKQMRITTLEWDGVDLLAASSNGAGADLSGYVAPTSCDINVTDAGTYPTLTAGIAAASDGDVICASGGDYHSAWEGGSHIIVDKEVTIVSTTGPANHTISAGLQIDADNVTISGFTLKSGNNILGELAAVYLNTVGLENVSIDGNIITGTVGAGYATGERGVIVSTGGTFTNVSITNNEIHNLHTGIYSNAHTGLISVTNNTFSENAVGIGGFTGLNAQFNQFTDNSVEAIGIDASYDGSGAVLTDNEFLNGDMVNDYGSAGVDAENNWWGDLDPSDQVTGTVDYTPFLTGPVSTTSLDANGNGYFDMHDFRAADITNVLPGLDPYAGPADDKEFKMAVQLDESTNNTFQGQSLSGVTIEFTLNQN